MHQLIGYHRPKTLSEARELLAAGSRIAVGGGTTIRHDGGAAPVEVVDLQSLGLDGINVDDSTIGLGATVRLQTIVDTAAVPPVIRDAARLEQPSTLRTLATIGGTIAARGGESILLAALLAHDAQVTFGDDHEVPLAEVLEQGVSPGALITSVRVETSGRATLARTGRTPADTPIVSAVGRTTPDGVRLALTGVASVPVLVEVADIAGLTPPGDFRGSPTYRRHLASVLAGRVEKELA